MPTATQFFEAFRQAAKNSSTEPLFQDMLGALGGTLSDDGKSIEATLDTSGRGSDSRVVEDAVRKKFNDDLKRSRYPDAYFQGVPIEVKHTTSGFGKIPTDSYGLVDTDKKWYLYVKGDVNRTERDEFTILLMRSDHLYTEVLTLLNPSGSSQRQLFRVPPGNINPTSQDALKDISDEIDKIKSSLSAAILRRAKGDAEKPGKSSGEETSMSLLKGVGLNRVRFDIKFESLLKQTILEILRD